MNPERIYLEHLEAIERIASFVARRRRLHAGEASELTVIRKFEGRSSFSIDVDGKTDVPGPSNRKDGNVARDGKEMLR
jgi:hypothetical protein